MCGSYKLYIWATKLRLSVFFAVRKSRGHCRHRPIGRFSTPAIGTDRGRHCYPENGNFGPFSPANRCVFGSANFERRPESPAGGPLCHAEFLINCGMQSLNVSLENCAYFCGCWDSRYEHICFNRTRFLRQNS